MAITKAHRRMTKATKTARIFATLEELRMLQEHSKLADDLQEKVGLRATVVATSKLDAGFAFVVIEGGTQRMVITVDYTVTVTVQGTNADMLNYFNRYLGMFSIDEL